MHQLRQRRQQRIVRPGTERQPSAQNVGGGARPAVFKHAHQLLTLGHALHRRPRLCRRIAGVQLVRRPMREQQDVARLHRDAALPAHVQPASAADHQVIGRHAGRFRRMVQHPGRAEMTADVQRGIDRIQRQQTAECAHHILHLRRSSKF